MLSDCLYVPLTGLRISFIEINVFKGEKGSVCVCVCLCVCVTLCDANALTGRGNEEAKEVYSSTL